MPQYDRKMLILSALSSAAYVLLVTAEIVFGEVSEFDALFCVAFCIFAVMVNYVRWFFTAEIMLMYGKVSQENYVELTAASAIPNKEIKSPQILRY